MDIDLPRDYYPYDAVVSQENAHVRLLMMTFMGIVTPMILLIAIGKMLRATWVPRVAWTNAVIMATTLVPFFAENYVLRSQSFFKLLMYNAVDIAIVLASVVESFTETSPLAKKRTSRTKKAQ